MKREIKFRVWYQAEKRMIEWEELSSDSEWSETRYLFTEQLSDVSPLMQYTGLKDKNGTEIYEGDIVAVDCDCDPGDYAYCNHPPVITYVDWFQENASFELRDATGEWSNEEFSDDYQEVYKVIGNIYENAGLLKGDAK